ncbi:MAG: hypothetical protein WA734_19125 [Candidatus Acidiferrales bacterium]
MKRRSQLAIPALLLILAVSLPALAVEYPLSSSSIRNAYFLGAENDRKTADFLAKYTNVPPGQKTGAGVTMIRAETPYVQVVLRSMQGANYSAQDAEQEFTGKIADFKIHATVDYGAAPCGPVETASGGFRMISGDCWRNFSYRLTQKKEIPAKSVEGSPVYSYGDNPVIVGGDVKLTYDISKIESGPAQFDVTTPDGKVFSATFDLDQLK